MISAEAVRTAVGVADYARTLGVELRRSGCELRGACPLCGGSKRASKFAVNPASELWRCFACGAAGDVIRLAELSGGCSFVDNQVNQNAINGLSVSIRTNIRGNSLSNNATQINGTPLKVENNTCNDAAC